MTRSARVHDTHGPVIVIPEHDPAAVYRMLVPRDFRIRVTSMAPVRRVLGQPEPLGLFLQDPEGHGPGLGVTMVRLPLELAIDRFMRILAEQQGASVSFVGTRALACGHRIELRATRGSKTLHQLGILDNGRLFQVHALVRTCEWPHHRDALWRSLTSFELGAPGLARSEALRTAARGPLVLEHPASWIVLPASQSVDPALIDLHAIDLAIVTGSTPPDATGEVQARVRIKVESLARCPPVEHLLATSDRELRTAHFAPARTKRPLTPDPAFAEPPEGWLGTFACEATLGERTVELRYGLAWRHGMALSLVGMAPLAEHATIPWLRMHAAFDLAARTVRLETMQT